MMPPYDLVPVSTRLCSSFILHASWRRTIPQNPQAIKATITLKSINALTYKYPFTFASLAYKQLQHWYIYSYKALSL